jgi:hypothetical protein
MKRLLDYIAESEFAVGNPVPGDAFDLEIDTDTLIESVVAELADDGTPIVELDEAAVEIMKEHGWVFEDSNQPVANDSISPIHGNAFAPYIRKHDPREWFRKDVEDHDEDEDEEHVSMSGMSEAKYHGREVPLGKRMAGDVKKSKVYVRKPNGNIVKVNFGDKKMRIKKSNPKRRKSFRARHNCANPGPRWKARYWSCRAW